MIALSVWQGLLDGLGWFLAKLYDLIPSYGVAIILFTVAIRLVLLPLSVKQFRSMQAMGAVAPKLKAIQQKYKGNRQKLVEEQQKLYREEGINPLAGCWPMLLQLPVLFALFSVLRFPAGLDHLPPDSTLYQNIRVQQGISFLGANLVCSAVQAGTQVDLTPKNEPKPVSPKTHEPYVNTDTLDCGSGFGVRIPYYVLAALMVGTTYYSSRQMQKANPTGSQQQQTLTRLMPLLFGVWGFLFPAGLVVYWTTSNLWQIGLQHLMVRAKQKGEVAAGDGKVAPKKPVKRSRFAEWMERAQQSDQSRRQTPSKGGSGGSPKSSGTSQSGSPKSGSKPASGTPGTPRSGSSKGSTQRSSGGRSGGSRKKRRKR